MRHSHTKWKRGLMWAATALVLVWGGLVVASRMRAQADAVSPAELATLIQRHVPEHEKRLTGLHKAPLPPLPDGYDQRLRDGEVIVMELDKDDREDQTWVDIVILAWFPLPLDRIFPTANDPLHYSEYMPGFERARLLGEMPGQGRVEARLWEFTLSGFMVRGAYQPIILSDPKAGVIEYHLNKSARNDMEHLKVHWWMYPIGDGSETLVAYAVKTKLTITIPRIIEERIGVASFQAVLKNTRERLLAAEGVHTASSARP